MRILVIGGSASGKSEYAEALALELGGPLFYIATMEPYGKEAEHRILRHHALREEKGFVTIERYTGLDRLVLPQRGTVLLECLGNLAANEQFSTDQSPAEVFAALERGIQALEAQCHHLIVVSNDIFQDGIVYPKETEQYQALLAAVNALCAQRFEAVAEVVCGIPCWQKGGRP